MPFFTNIKSGELRDHFWVVPSIFRLLFLIVAIIQLLFSKNYSVISPALIAIGVGIYSLVPVAYYIWRRPRQLPVWYLFLDMSVCFILVLITGGLYSPFLLYSICPVLSAALIMNGLNTFYIAFCSVFYIMVSHIVNPFIRMSFAYSEIYYLIMYMITISLVSTLPYMINANLRQTLSSKAILNERLRLSRELHDGIGQTIAAIGWQNQILEHELAKKGLTVHGFTEMEELINKAQDDTRDSLDSLREHNLIGVSFLDLLRQHLVNFRIQTGLKVHLEATLEKFEINELSEIELFRICQEALNNVKKHSGADHVTVNLKSNSNFLEVTIIDNGRGFNTRQDFHGGGNGNASHGLEVMKERAGSAGGNLHLFSLPGQGTEVKVTVPLSSNRSLAFWKRKQLS